MSVCVDLSNDHFTRAWRPTTTDRSVQKRIDQQYVSYTCRPCEETHYFQLDEHNLDFKTMRQIRKDDATRYRALRWLVEEEASSPAPPLAAEKKRPLPMVRCRCATPAARSSMPSCHSACLRSRARAPPLRACAPRTAGRPPLRRLWRVRQGGPLHLLRPGRGGDALPDQLQRAQAPVPQDAQVQRQ